MKLHAPAHRLLNSLIVDYDDDDDYYDNYDDEDDYYDNYDDDDDYYDNYDDNDDHDNNRVRPISILKLSITSHAYLVRNDEPILLGLHCFVTSSSCTSDTIP